MKKRLAIFDVDGTLFDGNLGIEHLKELMKRQIFDVEIGQEIMGWYGKYKGGQVEKALAVDEIYKLYARGMTGVREDVSREVASDVWESVKGQMFGFSADLVLILKEAGFVPVLISGSPTEMIELLGIDLGVGNEFVRAGRLEVESGSYTGVTISYPGSPEQKIEALDDVVERRGIEVDWERSIAFGDNERDRAVLKKVGMAVAVRPNQALEQLAKENGWAVVDAKNCIETVRRLVKL